MKFITQKANKAFLFTIIAYSKSRAVTQELESILTKLILFVTASYS